MNFRLWLESQDSRFRMYLMQLADALEERDYVNMDSIMDRIIHEFYDVLNDIDNKTTVSKKDLYNQLSQVKDEATVKRIVHLINGFTRDEMNSNNILRSICHFFCGGKNGYYFPMEPKSFQAFNSGKYPSPSRYETDIRQTEYRLKMKFAK